MTTMAIRLYADEYRCAIYDEAPGGGNPKDPNSLMNRPVVDPSSWLSNLYFHSELDYYSVVAYTLSTAITHPAIAGITRNAAGGTGEVSTVVTLSGQLGTSDHLLLTHSLGYVPDFYALINDKLAPNGIPVQVVGTDRIRFASVYATTTQIRVRTFGYSSASDLPSVSINYGVFVFREHAPIPTDEMLLITGDEVIFGQGKFKMDFPHLRVADPVLDNPLAIATDVTADTSNGALRLYTPNGGVYDWGSYDGSLSAPTFIELAVGV